LKDAADLRPKFIKTLLISFGIGMILFFFMNYNLRIGESQQFDIVRFVIIGMVVLCNMIFAPFTLYKRFNERTTGVSYFMLPASQLEKWIVMLFYCLIVTPLLSVAALTLADLCLLPLYPLQGTQLWFMSETVSGIFTETPLTTVCLYVLMYQSLFFLCNIWFQSGKVQKTVAIVIIIGVVNSLFSTLLAELFPVVSDLMKIARVAESNGLTTNMLHAMFSAEGLKHIASLCLLGGITSGLWFASFLKLKEQEL
jgi:hypothetical protein